MVSSRIVLSGVSPKLEGLQWESDSRLLLGQGGNDLDIVLHDQSVSRRHAEVFRAPQGWYVHDLGSKTGTLINGLRLGRDDQLLKPDDLLQCGTLVMRVGFLPGEPEPEPAVVAVAAANGAANGQLVLPVSHLRTSGTFVRVQAEAQHSWEEALQKVALDPLQGRRQGRQLLGLLRTGYHLANINSLDEMLQAILDDAVSILDAQRGSIVLADAAEGQLEVRAVATPRCRSVASRSYSKTLAERCFDQGTSLLCSDVSADADLVRAGSVLYGSMSSIICALLRSPRQRLGVLHLDRGPFQEPFSHDDFYLADAIAASVSVGIESAQLVAKQRDQFIQTITALARTVEVRDAYTANHTQRVTDYALLLAEQLNLSALERHHIRIGTPLHDIGKIGIDDAILRKPGRLTPDEFEMMKSHTLKGAAILEPIEGLGPVIPIVRHHHERWDGNGYPDGLASDKISRLARVVAVADAFDAMTSHRPYRPAMPAEKAFEELVRMAGSHFDPACVDAFLAVRAKVEAKLGP